MVWWHNGGRLEYPRFVSHKAAYYMYGVKTFLHCDIVATFLTQSEIVKDGLRLSDKSFDYDIT